MREIFYMSSCSRGLSHAYTKQSGIFTCFASYLNKHANISAWFFNVVVWAKWYTTKLWLSHFRCAKGYFESLQLFFSLFLDALIDVVLVSVFSGKEHICFWWPYCRYTKSDCCSQQGHHCLEGYYFTPSDPHQITKARVEKFHKMQRIIQLW